MWIIHTNLLRGIEYSKHTLKETLREAAEYFFNEVYGWPIIEEVVYLSDTRERFMPECVLKMAQSQFDFWEACLMSEARLNNNKKISDPWEWPF